MSSGGGGGSSGPTQTTSTQYISSLPEEAKPYLMKLMGKAEALTSSDTYNPYKGQQVAGLNPLQQQAMTNVSQFQPAAQIGQASQIAGQAGLNSLNAGANYAAQATDPSSMQGYMSPYMQNIVNAQKSGAIQDYAKSIPGMKAQASGVGGLGGTRAAIMEASARQGLMGQLGSIQSQGLQSAYKDAQQAQQFGAGLGMQGYGQAMQGASTLGNLGQTAYGQAMGINQAQMQTGEMQRQLSQQGLDRQYQDYAAAQRQPYQQLSYMSDLMRGLPLGTSTQSMYSQAAPSALAQYGGIAGGLGSMFMAGKS